MSLFTTEVEIKIEAGSKRPYLYQPLFINNIRVGGWYSTEFTDREIVADLNKSMKYKDEFFTLKSKGDL
jgi:hypothetical protein